MRSIKKAIRIFCALLLTFSAICTKGQTNPDFVTQKNTYFITD